MRLSGHEKNDLPQSKLQQRAQHAEPEKIFTLYWRLRNSLRADADRDSAKPLKSGRESP
jgi:hypothetical protein